jgi:hypothetical protein
MGLKKSTLPLGIILSLIILFPWETFSPGRFEDLYRYREYLQVGIRREETLFSSPLLFLFKEIVFQQWLFFIYDIVQDIEYSIFLLSLITIFIFYIAVKRLDLDYRISIFLLCPLMIDFFNSQLRNSLALSLFLLGYSCKKNLYKYLLFLASITFHLALLLLIFIYFILNFLTNRVKNKALQILILVAFSFFFAFGDKLFFVLINDPRMDVYTQQSGMSIIYFLWALALLCCLFILKLKKILPDKILDLAFIGSLLVVLSYFSGAYYGRYLAMFFPFILLAIGTFRINKPAIWVMSFYCFYTFIMNFVF